MNNIQGLFNAYNMLRQNPMELISRRFRIPPNMDVRNPNDIVQYLLNSGQISQQDVNQVMGLKNDPKFSQIFGGNPMR